MLAHPAKRELPPGPSGIPFVGNTFQFRRDQLGFLLSLQRTYGRMATVHIGKTPVVLLFRPEHVRYVLTLNPRNFTNREVSGGLIFGNLLILSLLARSFSGKGAVNLQDFVGDGLLTTDGDFHDRHRRLVQGAFARRRVENHAGLIVHYTQDALERWSNGDVVDLAHEIQAVILRIMAKILLDEDVRDSGLGPLMDGVLAEPVNLLEGILSLKVNLPFTPYARRMALLRQADDFVYSIIDRRRADNRDRGDVLSIMLHADGETDATALTRREIRDELVSLIAAGHETTTNSLAWTFYLLARYPAVLQQVLGEIQSVLGSRDPEVADLSNLGYLDCVVKESMRLYPSAWTQGRQAVEAFDLDGYHFPAGTLLMFSQWVLHRLPDVWGDPDQFRPDRWDPATGAKAPRWAYFPFGDGPRICLGMPLANLEIRLVLATILQRLVPELVPGHPVEPFPLITLRPRHGLRVRFTPAPATTRTPAPIDRLNPTECPYHQPSATTTERGRA
jgi:cytochrome P450